LLHKDVEVETVMLTRPRILIKKGTDGILDLVRSTPPIHKRAHGPIEIIATDGVVRYEEAKSGAWVEASGCDAKVHDVHTEAPDGRRALERLSFSGGDMACKTVTASKFTGTDLKVSGVAPGKGVYTLEPITLEAFGAQARGRFHAEFTESQDSYAADLKVPEVQIARILQDLKIRSFAEGRASLAGDISCQGKTHQEILQSVKGTVSAHGNNITLQGYDLDAELSRFEKTQHFDMTDLLAVAVVGPAGIVATKGYDYGRLLGKRGGVSHIHDVVADLDVSEGVVHTQDVAMSTDTHRMAAQGKLDLATEDFDHLTLALVDARGCVIAEDGLGGSIRKPKLQKPGVVKTLAGPVRRAVYKGEDLFTKKGCPVIYDGSVKPY
jgi:AsmA protein